jgi:hypothetical protein
MNRGLSAEQIADDIAGYIAALALKTEPSNYSHSILFPLKFFDSEVIETVKVVGGIRRVTVPFELVRIDFNMFDLVPLAYRVRSFLHLKMLPFLKGSGRVINEIPEGLVICLAENGEKVDSH